MRYSDPIKSNTNFVSSTHRAALLQILYLYRLYQKGYNSLMLSVSISTLKNSLSQYLRHVKRGETVVIMDRDKPVAEILPFAKSKQNKEGDLAILESQGLIRRGDVGKLKSWKPSLQKKFIKIAGSACEKTR